jgi:hypothetical protein
MLRFVLPGLAATALCGCGQGAPRQFPPDRPVWSTTIEQGRARLAYGIPNSDTVALAFECSPRSGRVTVKAPLEPGARRFVLASGTAVREIRGPTAPDPEVGLDVVAAGAEAGDAVLAAFARTGRLLRVDPGGVTALTASGPERESVRGFLGHCAR